MESAGITLFVCLCMPFCKCTALRHCIGMKYSLSELNLDVTLRISCCLRDFMLPPGVLFHCVLSR